MVTWLGENLCDAGFFINLKEQKDREKRTILELSKSGIEGVGRFDACVIRDPNYLKYGCTQSHIEISKLQIKNNWDYVLYLEDDIILDLFYDDQTDNTKIDLLNVSKNIISELKTFKPDVLWLGTRPEKSTQKITNTLLKPSTTLMSHAYLGSLKFAHFMIKNLKYNDPNHFSGGYPIDFFISQINVKDDWRLTYYKNGETMLNNDLLVCMSTPMIFNQGQSYSNLIDRDVSYEMWVRGSYSAYANSSELNIKKLLHE